MGLYHISTQKFCFQVGKVGKDEDRYGNFKKVTVSTQNLIILGNNQSVDIFQDSSFLSF